MSNSEHAATATVSTHILDTSAGRPAADVAVELSVRAGRDAAWAAHGASSTDADGRCNDLPALPGGTSHVRLTFEVEPYFQRTDNQQPKRAEVRQDAPRSRDSAPGDRDRGSFFPEVTVVFTVTPGEHYHVPLLLNPFGYSVYRGS